MVKLNRKPIEISPNEVLVDGWRYPKKIDPLQIGAGIVPGAYALVFKDDKANYALSMQQQLNGLAFYPMIRGALKAGTPLARTRDFTPFHRNVNLALQGEGVLYDASGNLIDKERLIEVGNAVNGAWVYLNDVFEESGPVDKGFLGLDVAHVTGFDGDKAILERQPLEECVVDCWVETESINRQGLYTKKAKVQQFEKGKTVYVDQPTAGSVAWFNADPDRAYLNLGRYPQYSYASLGGFLCAAGTAPKIQRESK